MALFGVAHTTNSKKKKMGMADENLKKNRWKTVLSFIIVSTADRA